MRCFFSIALSLLCVSASLPPFLTASHSPFLFLSAARSFGAPPSHLSSLLPSPLFHSSVSPPCLYFPLPSLSVSPSISSTLLLLIRVSTSQSHFPFFFSLYFFILLLLRVSITPHPVSSSSLLCAFFFPFSSLLSPPFSPHPPFYTVSITHLAVILINVKHK